MGDKSIVTINQTLHGYRNGHQLLANSCDLTSEVKRQLLFQSDLSGSLKSDSYSVYLTGYPLVEVGCYAIAKTWYAYEMPRPGCVWTQTFLIEFSDIGKFQDFTFLINLFNRPIDNYSTYSNPIKLDLKHSLNNVSSFDINRKLYVLERLYSYPYQPIFIPSDNPKEWEGTIISLWSDQWPRLRRSFTFCTGALEKREINGSEFDLQIVPFSIFNQLGTSTQVLTTRNLTRIKLDDWKNVLQQHPNEKLRRFLWLVGSDVPGNRENYYILLIIFNYFDANLFNITALIETISMYYPSPNTAKTLKRVLFGSDSILREKVSELEIIESISTPLLKQVLDLDSLDLKKRLLNLTTTQNLPFLTLYNIWKGFPLGTFDENIWNSVNFETISELQDIVLEDEELLNIFLRNDTQFIGSKFIWQAPLHFQKIVLEKAVQSQSFNWKTILEDILNNHSLIILDLYRFNGSDIISFSLDWLNKKDGKEYFTYEWQLIIRKNINIVKKWLYLNRKSINIVMYEFLYGLYTHYDLVDFNLPIDFWRRAARISSGNNNLLIAISTLSIGFSRKSDGGEWIITESFQFVYDSAQSGNIQPNQWSVITFEEYSEDESNWLTDIISLFGLEKKMKNVYDWDYCELLIRTLVNLYIKYPLDKQAFILTLRDEDTFNRAINYCVSMRKGVKFLSKLYQQQKSKSFFILPYQKKTLDNLKGIYQ